MYFVGIHLSTKKSQPHALSIFEGDELTKRFVVQHTTFSTEELLKKLTLHVGSEKPFFIAVDSPLLPIKKEAKEHIDERLDLLYGHYSPSTKIKSTTKPQGAFFLDWAQQIGAQHAFPKKQYERTRKIFSTLTEMAYLTFFMPLDTNPLYAQNVRDEHTIRDSLKTYQQHILSTKTFPLPKGLGGSLEKQTMPELLKKWSALQSTIAALFACSAWERPQETLQIGTKNDGYVYVPVRKKKISAYYS